MLEAVLNELSFRREPEYIEAVADDERTARQFMYSLVTCLSEGFRTRRIGALRTDEAFAQQQLAPGYSLPQWRNDPAVNRDLRALFRSFLTASPYFKEPNREILFSGVRALGLSSCFVFDSVSISWSSATPWCTSFISAELATLVENGELSYTNVVIRNVATVAHWTNHSEWIIQKQLAEVTDGPKILEYAPALFPHLVFGAVAKKQISRLNGTEPEFNWVVQALISANGEVGVWESGPFPHAKLPGPASGESETVNDSPRLKAMRIFQTENGHHEYCEHHMKCRGANQRIHYVFDGPARQIRICYVGEHLETAGY